MITFLICWLLILITIQVSIWLAYLYQSLAYLFQNPGIWTQDDICMARCANKCILLCEAEGSAPPRERGPWRAKPIESSPKPHKSKPSRRRRARALAPTRRGLRPKERLARTLDGVLYILWPECGKLTAADACIRCRSCVLLRIVWRIGQCWRATWAPSDAGECTPPWRKLQGFFI